MDACGLPPMDATPLPERRTHLRLPSTIAVRFRRREQDEWRQGNCTDISQGGIGLETGEVLVVGEVVEVQPVELDGNITLRGRVMYRHDQQYGVAFLDYTPSA